MGFFGDAALTVPVGKVSGRAVKLMEVTRASLYAANRAERVGNRISDIACAVQKTAESAGFSVVEDFAGHGIGRSLHEDPQVPNYFHEGCLIRACRLEWCWQSSRWSMKARLD